ncbi:uncharacterized protein RCC_00032 [Ramularia collo-cygni]|uniref:DUF4219 domain-containing protein n=1 Tax=Ramularia collo-cygni TaxID=112498 RepID=A0A2D3URH7_9PEZI|nr:uncharacterized protein RCC_00032 [Ramularia collo-cygni]CZT14057.1 uncharacterized protein RCC_00032 [Ramularia collo-cygni]
MDKWPYDVKLRNVEGYERWATRARQYFQRLDIWKFIDPEGQPYPVEPSRPIAQLMPTEQELEKARRDPDPKGLAMLERNKHVIEQQEAEYLAHAEKLEAGYQYLERTVRVGNRTIIKKSRSLRANFLALRNAYEPDYPTRRMLYDRELEELREGPSRYGNWSDEYREWALSWIDLEFRMRKHGIAGCWDMHQEFFEAMDQFDRGMSTVLWNAAFTGKGGNPQPFEETVEHSLDIVEHRSSGAPGIAI